MILCCGEALIDMIPESKDNGQTAYTAHSGGALFNTAIALGRLGVNAKMLTGLSTDLFGEQLRDSLHKSQVDTSLVIYSDRPSTLAFVKLTNGHALYTFYDENTAGRMITEADLPVISDDISTLYFGGICLCSEPGADTYRALAEQQSSNKVIMLDPNIRPSFISNESTFRARINSMIACADIVKVSDEDLDWILPGDESHHDKMLKLTTQGPSIVIMTRGKDGAKAITSQQQVVEVSSKLVVEVSSKLVEVVDTVGAGDTYNAGFLAKLSETNHLTKASLKSISVEALSEALAFGASVAAITVSRAGANPPWASEL